MNYETRKVTGAQALAFALVNDELSFVVHDGKLSGDWMLVVTVVGGG